MCWWRVKSSCEASRRAFVVGIELRTGSWMLPSNHLREITSLPGRLPSFSSCDKVVPLTDSGEKQKNTEEITTYVLLLMLRTEVPYLSNQTLTLKKQSIAQLLAQGYAAISRNGRNTNARSMRETIGSSTTLRRTGVTCTHIDELGHTNDECTAEIQRKAHNPRR